jgi:hypothetical protein
MGLISFKDYRAAHGKDESSPSTRNKWAAFLGLQPMYSADVFGHATPIAPVAEKLLAKLKDHKDKKDKGDKPKKKKESKKKKKKDESSLYETDAPKKPDRSFDAFIDKAERARKDVEKEQDSADKEEERLSKEIDKLSRKTDNDPKTPDKHDKTPEDPDDVVASLTKQAKKEPKPEKIKTPANQKPAPKTEANRDFSTKECNEWDQIFSSSLKESDEE